MQKPAFENEGGDTHLPASQKIYVKADVEGVSIRVPFREISLSPSRGMDGKLEENPPVRVYDTSGPWTDPEQNPNVREGLAALRSEWIRARGDVEEYEGREVLPQDNGYVSTP
ncbi:MAG: phosphomethylpyrimidine synthase, partial [Acidobacteria bacterium]|nr:phosphomethylpyrimidine synthase [Acidobacteriota bacterium]